MPSAPHRTQARKINSLYYAPCTGRKAHDGGVDVSAGRPTLRNSRQHLLMVQGPLRPNWSRRKWGVLPRLENGDLTGTNPPAAARLHSWLQAGVQVQGRPGWRFVKLHTHGAPERNANMLLGAAMAEFHRFLTVDFHRLAGVRVHYLTARELVNMLHAAESKVEGSVSVLRNFVYRRKVPPLNMLEQSR